MRIVTRVTTVVAFPRASRPTTTTRAIRERDRRSSAAVRDRTDTVTVQAAQPGARELAVGSVR